MSASHRFRFTWISPLSVGAGALAALFAVSSARALQPAEPMTVDPPTTPAGVGGAPSPPTQTKYEATSPDGVAVASASEKSAIAVPSCSI